MFGLAYTQGVISGPFNTKGRVKKIVVIQLAKLGDMVCTTPVFKNIKDKYPEAEVVVCGNAVNEKLLENNMYVDKYVVVKGFFSLIDKLKKEKVDVAIVVSPDFLAISVFILAKVKMIIAPNIIDSKSPYQTKEYSGLLKFVNKVDYNMYAYMPGEYLKLLKPLDIDTDYTKKQLGFDDSEVDAVDNILETGKLIGLAISVGNDIKDWPVERFVELSKKILEKDDDIKIVLIGTKKDLDKSGEYVRALGGDRIIDTTAKVNLNELKYLISKLDMFISVDTGPIYIAEAFGIPTIDILGPVAYNEQPPVGENHLIVHDYQGEPQLHIMDTVSYNYDIARKQVENITVEMVYAKFEELYSSLHL